MSLTDTPEIIVNGYIISPSDIDTEMQYHPAPTRRQAMIKAAESLIIGELLVQKAEEKGLSKNIDIDMINEQPALIDSLLDQEVEVPKATEEECLRYFEANTEKFTTSPLIEANHILLAADPKDLEQRTQMRELAENLIKQLSNVPEQFATLAKQYSVCSSRDVGGSLGQLSYGQTVSEFERQVFAADTGLMATPVESRFGYHVVFIAHKVEGKPLDFDVVKEKIKTYLNDKVQRKAISQYLNRIVSEATIEGYEFDIGLSSTMQ